MHTSAHVNGLPVATGRGGARWSQRRQRPSLTIDRARDHLGPEQRPAGTTSWYQSAADRVAALLTTPQHLWTVPGGLPGRPLSRSADHRQSAFRTRHTLRPNQVQFSRSTERGGRDWRPNAAGAPTAAAATAAAARPPPPVATARSPPPPPAPAAAAVADADAAPGQWFLHGGTARSTELQMPASGMGPDWCRAGSHRPAAQNR